VAIGFIALAGVAPETGVVMLIYLDHAWKARRDAGRVTLRDLYDAVVEGAVERVRPKMMTSITPSTPNPTREMLPASAPATTATSPSRALYTRVTTDSQRPRRTRAERSCRRGDRTHGYSL